MLGWNLYGFNKKHVGTCYTEHEFLHPVGSARQLVHTGVSWARNVDALFFMLGGTCTDSTKTVLGHFMLNFCFCIRWDLWVT
jgi:hypothetical protein